MKTKKLYLNTLEQQLIFEYDKAEIFTKQYDAKIKPKSLHCPLAAKIIITHKATMTALLVQLPIIKVDSKGNVQVYTQTDIKTVTLENKNEILDKSDLRLLRIQLSAVKAKKSFASTPLEIVKEKELSSKVELLKFIKKIHKYSEGGGF